MPMPYWVDEYIKKHECYSYDATQARTEEVRHRDRVLRLIVPDYVPPFRSCQVEVSGDLLALIGEQLDEEGVDGSIIEGGDGVLIVAREAMLDPETYWTFVAHVLYPEALTCTEHPSSQAGNAHPTMNPTLPRTTQPPRAGETE